MALTTLDPNTALIVVDLQKGIAGDPFPRLGETGTSREIVDLLGSRHPGPEQP
jgi:hypothetical protein